MSTYTCKHEKVLSPDIHLVCPEENEKKKDKK